MRFTRGDCNQIPFLGTQQLKLARRSLLNLGSPKMPRSQTCRCRRHRVSNQETRLGLSTRPSKHYSEARQTCPDCLKTIKRRSPTLSISNRIGYLRLGESENCVHLAKLEKAGILPISGAECMDKRSVRRIESRCSKNLLGLNPRSSCGKMAFDIASMTLGKYPRRFPEGYRIDLASLLGEPFPKFLNNARKIWGMQPCRSSGGVIADLIYG